MTPVITALPAAAGITQDADRIVCGSWVHLAATDKHPAGWHQVIYLRDTVPGRRFILANGIVVDAERGDRVYVLPGSVMSAYLAEGVLPWNQ